MSTQEQVAALVGPVAAAHGLILDRLEVTAAGKRRLVRVTLDSVPAPGPDGWVTTPTSPLALDDLADVSREIDRTLDDAPALGSGPYVLEVSSPGVGRPLDQPRHYQRNVGRLLVARTASGEVTGRILRAGAAEVVLALTDAAGAVTETTLPYAAITRAHVEVEFASAPSGDDEVDMDEVDIDEGDMDEADMDEDNAGDQHDGADDADGGLLGEASMPGGDSAAAQERN